MSIISSSTVRSDYGKINQLFEKISKFSVLTESLADSSNNLEIEERSIKNIAQKVQLSLLTPAELAVNHG